MHFQAPQSRHGPTREGKGGNHRPVLNGACALEAKVADGLDGIGASIGGAETNKGEAASQQFSNVTNIVVGCVAGAGDGIGQSFPHRSSGIVNDCDVDGIAA